MSERARSENMAGKESVMVMVTVAKRESGFVYFLNKEGDLGRKAMRKKDGKSETVRKLGVQKEKGWLYFIDGKEKMSVWKAPMKRRGKGGKLHNA